MSIRDHIHERKRKFDYVIPESAQFVSLSKLPEKVKFPINGFYFSTGMYGKSVVIMSGDNLVNIPKHLTETFEDIYNDDEAVAEINAGLVYFSVYSYHPKASDAVCYSINIHLINEEESSPSPSPSPLPFDFVDDDDDCDDSLPF